MTALKRHAVAARTSAWPLVAVSLGVLFYAAFIARAAFVVDGRVYFALFDDMMVSMRYARNLAEGHGLLWNPGEDPVEGYTNFLWTGWMALLHLLPIADAKAALPVMLSGAAILVATIVVAGPVARRLVPEGRLAAPLSMVAVALYYPLCYWTLRGTEVGLITLLVLAQILLALRLEEDFSHRDLAALAAVMASTMLTRTDAIVPAVIVAGYLVVTTRRRTSLIAGLVLVGALAATLAAHTAFRALYYGDPLPNTYYLKIEGTSLLPRLQRGMETLAHVELVHLSLPTLLAALLLAARGRSLPRGAYLLAAIYVGQCAYSLYVGGDAWEWMHFSNRYIVPGVVPLLILAATSLEVLITQNPRRLPGTTLVLAGALTAVSGLLLTRDHWLPWVGRSGDALGPTTIPAATSALVAAALLLWPSLTTRSNVSTRPWAWGSKRIVPFGLGLVFLVAINGEPMRAWISHDAYETDIDALATRYGVVLRDATGERASLAVGRAGVIPYFSHRRSIDLLGKSDRVIARKDPNAPFFPGHNKWDYDYSINRLRPDVAVFEPSKRDVATLAGWGYKPLFPDDRLPFTLFVRSDTRLLNRAYARERLRAATRLAGAEERTP